MMTMTAHVVKQPVSLDPPALLKKAWAFNPTLTLLLVAMLITSVLGFIGLAADPRTVLNAPTWAKTTKFSISTVFYSATLLWMLTFIKGRPRLVNFLGTSIGGILLFEMAAIILQGARARAMHFNVATPLDATLWSLMTGTIFVLYFINLIGAALLLFTRIAEPALAWGIRLGFLVMVLGMTQGFLMPGPNDDQLARLQAGEKVDLIGAHTVGAPDGGPGLPLLGWSTTHGDLRIGHFVGLHGMQAIPLLAFLVSRRRERWLKNGHRKLLVAIGAAGYTGLVALVTWQALRGQPLFSPDGLTLATLGALIAVTLAAGAAVVLAARRAEPRSA
jgi:hypothetical protein